MSEKFVIQITRGAVGDLPKDVKSEVTSALALRFAGHHVFVREMTDTEINISDMLDNLKSDIKADIEESMHYHEYHHDHTRNDRY